MEHYNKAGFTLIELLVSIAIIATLSAILLPNLMGARDRAIDSQRIQDMVSMKNALRLYYNDNQKYPDGNGVTDIGSTLVPKYMPATTGIGFTYYVTNGGDGFQLCTQLNVDQAGAGADSQIKCGIGTTRVCGVDSSTPNLYVVCAN